MPELRASLDVAVMRVKLGGEYRRFWCPGCEDVHCLNSGWAFNGDVEKPTFSPSVLVTYGPGEGASKCHSWVENGQIRFLADSTHALAGKTVDLPEYPPGF